MLLEVNHLKKNYGDFQLDCSLQVENNQVVGLIGRNGAGKTTLFKILMDLVPYEAGEIKLFGKEFAALTAMDKEKIGVAYSDSGFSKDLTLKQVAQILAGFYPAFQKEKFLTDCQSQKLKPSQKLAEYSTGMLAKLKIIIATSFGADLLILDEPTAGLDLMARNDLLQRLHQFMEEENHGILISSHISSDLKGLCDFIYLIDDGKIIFKEETAAITDFYGVVKLTPEQYQVMEPDYLLFTAKENWGYQCLTDQRQFFLDNYPNVVVEKATLDNVLEIILGRVAV
ncbi:ATP-binding cassette domain-containing protein [Enterococcus sp. LJL120]